MAVDYTPSFDPADVDSDYGSTGGDITVPTFTANMKPFRFWCQRALPLVYDDSLSYYEVLCKVVDQMNGFLTDLQTATGSITEFAQQFVVNQQFLNDMAAKLGQDVDTLETYINDRMEDFTNAYEQLQSYVNNYFDNLDVQQEINNKLDEMSEDGTFNTLFNPVITAWMAEKTAQIDEDLSNQNQTIATQNSRISVLEGRMDSFASLPAGSTSGNAELIDIRTNFLGETFSTAGDAVRVSDLIASGFSSQPIIFDWIGESLGFGYFDTTRYKGGKIAFIVNTMYDGITEYGRLYIGNTITEVSPTIRLYSDSDTDPDHAHVSDYLDEYQEKLLTSNENGNRFLVTFSIPSTFAYLYIGTSVSRGLPQPDFIVYASNWIETPIDPTLTQPGDAADAKATGDAIGAVNDSLESLVSDTTTTEIKPINETETLSGAYSLLNNEWVFRTEGAFGTNFITKKFDAKPNTRYVARANIYANCAPMVFTDEDNNVLSVAGYDSTQGYGFKGVFVDSVSPANTRYLYIMNGTGSYSFAGEYAITPYKESVMSLLRNSNSETYWEKVTGAVAYSGDALALRTNGTWAGWSASKYKVFPGEVYTIRGAYTNVHPIGAFVKADLSMTPIWRDTTNATYTAKLFEITVSIPDNVCEVWINKYGTWGDDTIAVYRHLLSYKGSLIGKKWYTIGDSITEYNTTANVKYYDYIQEKTGVLPINLAAGGRGYINGGADDTKQFYKQALEIGSDADLVTILGGGNDVSSFPLGEVTDTGTETICGCINRTIDNVYATLPLAKLGIITPNPWGSFPTDTENNMSRLADAIVAICKRRGIPYLDLYHCSGMRPWEQSYRELVYSLSNNDGVHPNNIGHEIIASHVEQFIKEILVAN